MMKITFNKKIALSVLSGAFLAATLFSGCQEQKEVEPVLYSAVEKGGRAEVVPGKYIVVFKKEHAELKAAGASHEARVAKVKEFSNKVLKAHKIAKEAEQAFGSAIAGFVATLDAAEVQALAGNPNVAYIEADQVITLKLPATAKAQAGTSQSVPYGINRVGYADGTGKTAWVIDSGIDLDHPDLNVDVARSRTFFTSGRDAKSADDLNGHGTHVAGTIAAKNNSIGVLGVAYNARVVAVKVLNASGSGSTSTVIAGIDYVGGHAGAGDVANMSLGGSVSQAIDDAVKAAASKGVRFAIAAGNEAQSTLNSSPARVNHPNVFTISAMDINNKFASFSNFDNPPVDFCAPGVSINSTWKGGGYSVLSGTSMASPHVAGLLLLGTIKTDGFVLNDPDGQADPIAHK